MTLKMKLTSTICAFLLILGLTIMGVMASPSATVNLGGSISFNATGVNAKVTGEVTGHGNEEDPELLDLLFQEEYTASEEEDFDDAVYSWGHCDLVFDNSATPIEITVTIENLADRDLYVSATENLVSVNNLTKTIDNGAFKLGGKETGSMTITLEVTNPNASLEEDATYSFDIDLKDTSAIPTADSLSDTFAFSNYSTATEGASVYSTSQQNTVAIASAGASEYDYSLEGDIVIPAYVQDNGKVYAVTAIADEGFGSHEDQSGSTGVTSFTLPNTIEIIGDSAFAWSENGLQRINIPSSVTTIGDYAFECCYELERIQIPAGVTNIGEYAFDGCNSLASIVVDENNTVYDNRGNCNALIETETNTLIRGSNNVYIPEGIEVIAAFAFNGCRSLTSITITASVTEIGEGAFGACSRLVEIYNQSGITITETSFGLNASVNPDINIYTPSEGNSKIKEIDEYVFFNNGNGYTLVLYKGEEADITLPSNIDFDGDGKADNYTIRKSAFFGRDHLTSVIIPDCVTNVYKQAFDYCSNLKSITIPYTIKSISYGVFQNCTNLTTVYYTGTEEQWNAIAIGENNDPLINATRHYNSTGPSEE